MTIQELKYNYITNKDTWETPPILGNKIQHFTITHESKMESKRKLEKYPELNEIEMQRPATQIAPRTQCLLLVIPLCSPLLH